MAGSLMDTRLRGQGQTISTGTCFLMVDSIKGDANTGPVKEGHEVYYINLGVSKAVAPGMNGVLLASGRVISTAVTLIMQDTPHTEEFMQAAFSGKILGKVTIVLLKNHGQTASEGFRLEITNARIVNIRSNMKRTTNGTGDDQESDVDENIPGWAMSEDARSLSMSQDPFFQKSDGDVFKMKLVGDAFSVIYSPVNEDGSLESGKVPAYFNFIQNTTEVPA